MAGDYAIGSDNWPGLAKFVEEASEAITVAAKLIATGGFAVYFDGTDLRHWLEDELADVIAAVRFVEAANELDADRIDSRARGKLGVFNSWHEEHGDPYES